MDAAGARIVTLKELESFLVPLCRGDKWAISTISDLWKKGAPVPQPEGEIEKRILIPLHFMAWYNDLNQRLGTDVVAERAHKVVSKHMNRSAGMRTIGRRGSGVSSGNF